jgi:hypothetical protein
MRLSSRWSPPVSRERYTYYRFAALAFGAMVLLQPWVAALRSWGPWVGEGLILLPVVTCALLDRYGV